jgi:preprotein translocase subunit SecA
VISDLWVDYLTKVEALRVSIGLEAYAQRDPLVMYKGRASEMFKELLSDIRAGVISRMFVYRPRQASPAPEKERIEALHPAPAGAAPAAGPLPKDGRTANSTDQSAPQPGGGKKKRKRH